MALRLREYELNLNVFSIIFLQIRELQREKADNLSLFNTIQASKTFSPRASASVQFCRGNLTTKLERIER